MIICHLFTYLLYTYYLFFISVIYQIISDGCINGLKPRSRPWRDSSGGGVSCAISCHFGGHIAGHHWPCWENTFCISNTHHTHRKQHSCLHYCWSTWHHRTNTFGTQTQRMHIQFHTRKKHCNTLKNKYRHVMKKFPAKEQHLFSVQSHQWTSNTTTTTSWKKTGHAPYTTPKTMNKCRNTQLTSFAK